MSRKSQIKFAPLEGVPVLDRDPDMHGFVYVVQIGHDGPVKIGFSESSPLARIQSLQTSSPHGLVVRAILHGDREMETMLHSTLADTRLKGEWFMPHSKGFWLVIESVACALGQVDLSTLAAPASAQRESGEMPRTEAVLHWRDPTLTSAQALAKMRGWTKARALYAFGKRGVGYGLSSSVARERGKRGGKTLQERSALHLLRTTHAHKLDLVRRLWTSDGTREARAEAINAELVAAGLSPLGSYQTIRKALAALAKAKR